MSKSMLVGVVAGVGLATAGGVLGYLLAEPWRELFPYLLVVAASSFIYVAVADLIPQLQRRLHWRDTLAQIGWIAGGLASVVIIGGLHRH